MVCRRAWKALGDITQGEAQVKIAQILEDVCPKFKEAVLNHLQEEKKER